MTHEAVAAWLDAYIHAWQSNDPQAIADLFAEDAAYFNSPYSEPIRGRDAIVASWLDEPDAPGTFGAEYTPLAVDGDLAVAHGRSRYFEADGTTPRAEFDNIFVLRFDADGRCAEYREWYMHRPREG